MEKFNYQEILSSAKMNRLVDELNADTKNIENLNKTLYDEEVGDIPTLEKKVEKVQEDVEEAKLFKFPNATIKGDLNINHGQVSGFSNENYLILPFAFNVAGKAFELNLAFTTGSDVTIPQNIIGSKFCLAAYIQSGKLTTRISTSGTNWEISKELSFTVTPNTTYYIKLSYDRLQYKLQYSTDGKEYSQSWVEVNPNYPAEGLIYIGVGNNFNNPFGGIINLNKCELLINNQHYWEGMDDAGLATRLATDLSNIDEEGVDEIKEIIKPELDTLSEKVSEIENNHTSVDDIKEAMESLPDGQAVSAQVALNKVICDNAAESLDSTKGDVDLEISDEQGNVLAVFAKGHIKTKYFNSADIKAIQSSVWNGKKIAWYGTSIPAGYPNQNNQNVYAYPNIIASKLGASIQNYCVPNGVVRSAKSNGATLTDGCDALSFTKTSSAINYQNSLVNLIGTTNEPDLFVFDYGVNDYGQDKTDTIDYASRDTKTFVGAMGFVLEELYKAKPTARVVLITHFSDDGVQVNGHYGKDIWKPLNEMIKGIAEYWGVKLIDARHLVGWHNTRTTVGGAGSDNMLANYVKDGIHPAYGNNVEAVKLLANIYYNELIKTV